MVESEWDSVDQQLEPTSTIWGENADEDRRASERDSVEEQLEPTSTAWGENADEDRRIADLIASDSGSQLLNLVMHLAQRMGSESRFSEATDVLRRDVSELRAQTRHAETWAPAEGSSLHNPEVRESMQNLLHILRDPMHTTRLDANPPWTPASRKAIQDLVEIPLTLEVDGEETVSELECPVCLDPMSGVVLQMPCSLRHVFHRACLLRWLDFHNSCPVCRHELPTDEDADACNDVQEGDAP